MISVNSKLTAYVWFAKSHKPLPVFLDWKGDGRMDFVHNHENCRIFRDGCPFKGGLPGAGRLPEGQLCRVSPLLDDTRISFLKSEREKCLDKCGQRVYH